MIEPKVTQTHRMPPSELAHRLLQQRGFLLSPLLTVAMQPDDG